MRKSFLLVNWILNNYGNMNAKFFVPFETAKILKEKGYPQDFAHNDALYTLPNGEFYWALDVDIARRCSEGEPILAPTYCDVLDWLIENKIAVITVEMCEIMWNIHPIDEADMRWYCNVRLNDTIVQTDDFDTRWEAINEAILEALEMI